VSLIAVLIPLLFMQDVVGRLFREIAIHAERDDPGIRGRVTDVDSHDVLENSASPKRFGKELVLPRVREFAQLDHRSLCGNPAIRSEASTGTLVVTVGTLAFTGLLFFFIPKGFFPVQDTGVILGVSEAPADAFHFQRWRRGSKALAKSDFEGFGRGEPLVVYRD